MGQAKKRGTFEQRKAEAIQREADRPKPTTRQAVTRGSLALAAAYLFSHAPKPR